AAAAAVPILHYPFAVPSVSLARSRETCHFSIGMMSRASNFVSTGASRRALLRAWRRALLRAWRRALLRAWRRALHRALRQSSNPNLLVQASPSSPADAVRVRGASILRRTRHRRRETTSD